MSRRRVIFVYFEQCEVLDFAGPLQALHEANGFGGEYELLHCAAETSVRTAQGLQVSDLAPLPENEPNDLLIIPGYPVRTTTPPRAVVRWIRAAYESGAQICSVCTGAFALAHAGLLNGRQCTTHWKRVTELRQLCPAAEVVADRLFVDEGRIVTSAGIASGIDMALALIEKDHGPLMAAKVAREMVVYMRRGEQHHQSNVYLDFRTHLHPGIHAVQDWLIANPQEKKSLEALAALAHMSLRNLTRVFREATGISIHEYRTRLRLERAHTLMRNPEYTLETIALECGFADARQLRRLWRTVYDEAPSRARRPASKSRTSRVLSARKGG